MMLVDINLPLYAVNEDDLHHFLIVTRSGSDRDSSFAEFGDGLKRSGN